MKKILLHIGKHKTGSTSFQLFLRKARHELESQGIFPMPHGLGGRLAAVCIRDRLPIPPVLDMGSSFCPSPEEMKEAIQSFIGDKEIETLLITSEHFSYFRTESEIERLRSCLPSDVKIFVYLVLRDPEEFLKSYRDHITTTGHGPSSEPHSPYYCDPDSWLTDDQAIIDCWEQAFDRLEVIEYTNSGMINRLGGAMELPEEVLNKEYRLNTNSPWLKRFKNHLRKILKSTALGRSGLKSFRRRKWG